jgi:amino acid permease
LFLPLLVDNISLSLQYLAGYPLGDCVGYWKMIVFFLVVVLINLVKSWQHVAWMTWASLIVGILQAFVLIPYASVKYKDEIQASDLYVPAQMFGHPDSTWNSIGLALGSIAFSFAPIYYCIEMMDDMEKPEMMKKALSTSFCIDIVFYLVAGTSLH